MAERGDDKSRDYHEATEDLASALCGMWHACEVTGANLPEALSYALGLAAVALVHEATTADPHAFGGNDADQDLATGVLVAQRPGSWEAAHVVQLTYPLNLLAPGGPGRSSRLPPGGAPQAPRLAD